MNNNVNLIIPKKPELKGKYYQATGSRKRSIARIRLYPGKGDFYLNGVKVERPDLIWTMPLVLLSKNKSFDVSIKVKGGGSTAQKEAIRHGIARALIKYDLNLKTSLRKAGYLTRDPREKERKKPGLKRARKAPQWQKR